VLVKAFLPLDLFVRVFLNRHIDTVKVMHVRKLFYVQKDGMNIRRNYVFEDAHDFFFLPLVGTRPIRASGSPSELSPGIPAVALAGFAFAGFSGTGSSSSTHAALPASSHASTIAASSAGKASPALYWVERYKTGSFAFSIKR
jgi:hypothetical protein